MKETIIVNYLKYDISYEVADLVGFDKRKKEIPHIHIPSSIKYNNKEYPVKSISRDCFLGLSGKIVEIPNTIRLFDSTEVDLIPYTGKEEHQYGMTLRVYEARTNPPKIKLVEKNF